MRKRISKATWILATCLTLLPQLSRAQPPTPSTTPADPLPADSVWVNESLTLTVLERKGKTFRGKLVGGATVERTFSGTVEGNKVAWLAKDVQATKGGQGGDNTGTIKGDRIDFEYGAANRVSGTFTLHRSDGWRTGGKKDQASGGGTPTAQAAATVTVDFSKRVSNVNSMSGFLASMNDKEPPDEIIEAVRPALVRLGPPMWVGKGKASVDLPTVKRLARMKIPTIVLLKDTWHSSTEIRKDKSGRPIASGAPFQNYSAWEDHVREVARDSKGYEIIWDIWNEPDSKLFWKGDRQQLCETFVRGAKVLRKELGPQLLYSGPSLAQYDPQYISEFLDYCKALRIPLPILCWHEFVDQDIPSVTEHLLDARQRFVKNPAYASLGIKKIHINECVGAAAYFQPGEILGYLKALEIGGADGACRSTWGKDSKGVGTWSNTSLDATVSSDTHQPRAAWWAYKHYADSVTTRVHAASSDIRIPTFASRGNAKSKEAPARVLMGYYAYKKSPTVMASRLRLQGLQAISPLAEAKKVRVRIEQIPNSGEQPVAKLKTVAEDTLAIVDGAAETRPFNLVLHEAYVVTLVGD